MTALCRRPGSTIATCVGTAYQLESQLDQHTRAHSNGVVVVCICYDGAMPLPLPAIATCDGNAYQQEPRLDPHTRAHSSSAVAVDSCYGGTMPPPLPGVAT